MTTYTKASEVSDEIARRLQTISPATGYETNIGVNVLRGRRKLPGDDEAPCCNLIEGSDEILDTVGRTGAAIVKVEQSYVIDSFDVCDPDNPNDKAHAMIRDVKKALFKDGRTLGGVVVALNYKGRDMGARPDGVAMVQSRVMISVEFAEDLANP